MNKRAPIIVSLVALASLGALGAAPRTPQTTAPQTPPASQQPAEVQLILSDQIGVPPRFAVPDFLALSNDAETAAVAEVIGPVLWEDLAFEREFYMIPRDTYRTIPAARSVEAIPFDSWRELGADAVVFGTVERVGESLRVQVRLYNARNGQSVFGREYTGSAANPRLFAHTMADEIHQNQRALRGVARTRIAFSSDRDGERLTGPVDNRGIKEIYISDYDGMNQRRVTVNRSLNIFPVWSADARAIVFTTYRRGNIPDLFVSHIYQGTFEEPTRGQGHNWLAAWSPDGTRIAFTSNRDGNPEIYVMDADGSNARRLTNHPAIDTTPTWSPTGNQIAFTSDRSGAPQIWVMAADGLTPPRRLTFESYADRPTWSPAPYNEIAYAGRSGPGFDIRILDVASGDVRQITFGEGTNESPSYAPNGRHLAFTSTRSGRSQVFTIARDGRGLRQITRDGNNFTPNWSP